MEKYRDENIIEAIINILGFEESNTMEAIEYYMNNYKDKKYKSLEEINKDITQSISLISIKKANESRQIDKIIINQGYVEYINAGKNNREIISKKVLKNKDNINSLRDLKEIIDEMISTSQAEVDKIINLEEFELMEKLKQLNIYIDEKFIDIIVENLKNNKKVKSVEDIKEVINYINDREKNRVEEVENTMTITVDF